MSESSVHRFLLQVSTADFEIRNLRFQTWFVPFSPRTNHFNSLNLSFCICKLGEIPILFQMAFVKMKGLQYNEKQ